MRKVNLIPMAGDGRRFFEKGIKTPKPLILIDNIHMVIKTCLTLPKPDLWIFVCKSNHLNKYPLEKILKKYFKNSIIIKVDNTTKGQASSCLLAANFLKKDDNILISSCDTSLIFDHKEFFINSSKNNIIVLTAHPNLYAIKNPKDFSWVTSYKNIVTNISVKSILDKKKLGRVMVGSFNFHNSLIMIKYLEKIIDNGLMINNEYYIDTIIKKIFDEELEIYDYQIQKYISWGTPEEVTLSKKSFNEFN